MNKKWPIYIHHEHTSNKYPHRYDSTNTLLALHHRSHPHLYSFIFSTPTYDKTSRTSLQLASYMAFYDDTDSYLTIIVIYIYQRRYTNHESRVTIYSHTY